MWLIAACGAPPAEQQQPAATAQAGAAPSAVRSPVSINASMVSIVDHAGHELWNVEREGNAPKTRQDWENLAEHATQLAAAGALVRVAGTGVQDETWVATPSWQKWARAMSDAAVAARKAIDAEDFKALVAANGQLVESCESCHKEFKPQLPSEGITHGHAHESAP
jgi:cytochrome c556